MVQVHGCICNWGEECEVWHKFFKAAGHEWGDMIKYSYSDTCDFQNVWHSMRHLLRPSAERRQEIEERGSQARGLQSPSGKSSKRATFKIAKHHMPLEIIRWHERENCQWTAPMSRETVVQMRCFGDRNLSNDTIIQFDPSLGGGRSEQWMRKNPHTMYIKAPTVSRDEVRAVYASLQPDADAASAHARTAAIDRARHNEEERRSTEDWRAIVADHERNIAALRGEVADLLKDLELKDRLLAAKSKAARNDVNKHRNRTARAVSSLDREETEANIEYGSKEMFRKVRGLLKDAGGISRLTIVNDDWHEKHKDAAKFLWGYHSWSETKLYINAYFPGEIDIDYDPTSNLETSKDGDIKMPYVSPLEKCLLSRMFFHCFSQQQVIALCFDRDRTRIGQILKEWAPKWGNVGLDLGCLDVTADYLNKEVPDRNIRLGKPKALFTDGKDWRMAPKQNDVAVPKCTYSSKTEQDSARSLAFSSAGGLGIDFLPLLGGRSGEKLILGWWGSLGIEHADVESWEDVAINDPWTPADDSFWTALSDILEASEYEEILKEIEEGGPLVPVGGIDDGVLLTGEPTGLAKLGLENFVDSDTDISESGADESQAFSVEESSRNVFGVADALKEYEEMVQMRAVEKSLRESGSEKRPPVLTPEILNEQNAKALRHDPNMSGKTKMRQLERHERLHRLYEEGDLRKCLLSYFLLVTADDRQKLLSWMGSTLATIPKPKLEDLPQLPLRLAKIPEDYALGADKGFKGVERLLPNLNDVITPEQVSNSKKERLSKEQIMADIPLTTIRAPSETFFFRVDNEAILKEKIPYWIIPFLPHGHALAHGEANLCQPLRRPGRYSIVGDDYWDNEKNYTRRRIPTQSSQDIGLSSRRMCSNCKASGIVQYCSSCKKWYHLRAVCHDFDGCCPPRVHNPY